MLYHFIYKLSQKEYVRTYLSRYAQLPELFPFAIRPVHSIYSQKISRSLRFASEI